MPELRRFQPHGRTQGEDQILENQLKVPPLRGLINKKVAHAWMCLQQQISVAVMKWSRSMFSDLQQHNVFQGNMSLKPNKYKFI